MKVLQINAVFNNNSSTGKLTNTIHSSLIESGHKSVVCYGYGKGLNIPEEIKLCNDYYVKANHLRARISGLMYGGCYLSTTRLIGVIKKEKPDIVHLQCINGFFINIYRLINWLKINKIKTVITLHADFIFTANCGHALECTRWMNGCGNCPSLNQATESFFFDRTAKSWSKMKKAFEGFENNLIVVSVSPWLMERAKASPILKNMNHRCIYNGLDTKVFYNRIRCIYADKFISKDKKNVLCVFNKFTAKKDDFKGSDKVIELARLTVNDSVRYVVVGEKQFEGELPGNIVFTGRKANQDELAQLYSKADVTLLTSKKETFSMITAESLCCGTPVVGFKAGAPERIALKDYSEFVEYGNIPELRHALLDLANSEVDSKALSADAVGVYSSQKMCGGYLDVYRESLGEGH